MDSSKEYIYGLPSVIIIELNRGDNNKDFNEEFNFPLILDFTGENIIINQNSFHKFYLCGMISYIEKNNYDYDTHFISYSRYNSNDNFVCYDDKDVYESSVEEALSSRIPKYNNKNKIPYILFYHYMK